ncbi:hypothetical protein [Streptomyces sp. NPDC057702]|uniref:hypothetical protein n=1 Tax=unclassified Streptomyces TaxID=2593676 RepID=UPI0036A276FF
MSAGDPTERPAPPAAAASQGDPGASVDLATRPRPPADEPSGGSVMDWALLVCGSLLLVGVAVDAMSGMGLAWVTLAWGLILLPEGVRRVLAGRGDARRADRVGPVAAAGTFAATVICWAGLAYDWSQGNGTSWLVLVATVLLTAGGVCWLARRLLPRR